MLGKKEAFRMHTFAIRDTRPRLHEPPRCTLSTGGEITRRNIRDRRACGGGVRIKREAFVARQVGSGAGRQTPIGVGVRICDPLVVDIILSEVVTSDSYQWMRGNDTKGLTCTMFHEDVCAQRQFAEKPKRFSAHQT